MPTVIARARYGRSALYQHEDGTLQLEGRFDEDGSYSYVCTYEVVHSSTGVNTVYSLHTGILLNHSHAVLARGMRNSIDISLVRL